MSELDEMLKPKKVWQKWWIWMTFFLLVALGVIFYRYAALSKSIAFSYVTEPLYKGDLNMTVTATGYIYPVRSVDVGSEISGTIKDVAVDFNDRVRKGDVLATIDQSRYFSSFKRAEATLLSAQAVQKSVKADMELKESNYQRDKTLRKNSQGTLPIQKDWDKDLAAVLSAQAMYESSKANVLEAKFAFESTKYDLDKTVIYAPIEGVVLVRNIDPGQTVAAAFQTPVLFKLANDLSQMELHVSIDEADIAQIRMGQHVFFSVDAYPDTNFNARVKLIRVNSEMVAGVVTYKALLSVDNEDHRLLPGMSADANIVTKHIENAWIVPRSAMLYTPVDMTKTISFGPQNTEKLDIDMHPHVWVQRGEEIKKIYVEVLGTRGAKTAVKSALLKTDDKLILSQEQQ